MKTIKLNVKFSFQPDDVNTMKYFYECCSYQTQPYPTFMIVNQHVSSTCVDDGILVPSVSHRAPVIPIPEPPMTVDLKLNLEPPEKKQRII